MMNELDKLKDAWQSISQSNSSRSFTSDELRKMVKRRSNNEISKIKRKIILEWVISILLSVGLVVYVYVIDPAKTLWVVIYISIIIILGLFPYLKIVRFNPKGGEDLRQHLINYIAAFDLLVRQYIKINTFLIPIALLMAYLFGFIIGVDLENEVYKFRIQDLVLGLSVVGAITFIGYLVLKRYFNWIYGKNINRLKHCLNDLSEIKE